MLAIDKYMHDNVSELFWEIIIIIIIIIIESVLTNAISGKKSRGGGGDPPKVPLGRDLRVPLRSLGQGVIHYPTT